MCTFSFIGTCINIKIDLHDAVLFGQQHMNSSYIRDLGDFLIDATHIASELLKLKCGIIFLSKIYTLTFTIVGVCYVTYLAKNISSSQYCTVHTCTVLIKNNQTAMRLHNAVLHTCITRLRYVLVVLTHACITFVLRFTLRPVYTHCMHYIIRLHCAWK